LTDRVGSLSAHPKLRAHSRQYSKAKFTFRGEPKPNLGARLPGRSIWRSRARSDARRGTGHRGVRSAVAPSRFLGAAAPSRRVGTDEPPPAGSTAASPGSSLRSARPDRLDICATTAVGRAAGRLITHAVPELVGDVLDGRRAATRGAPGQRQVLISPDLLTGPATARMKGSHVPRVSGKQGGRR
jgi:hypothetical protein